MGNQSLRGLPRAGFVHAETNAADDIRSPKKMKASAIDEMCLSCHKNQPTHVGRLQSSHARNSVSCTIVPQYAQAGRRVEQ